MSSQGSSSIRVYTIADFATMVGDTPSMEVFKPSISLIESVPEVASRPGDEGVLGPDCELVSTSGRTNEEEEEVEVSCSNLRSTITMVESKHIATRYGLKVVIPCDLER